MPESPSLPVEHVRRARRAVAALFLTNGALLANVLPRYPEIKQQLALENSTYGLAIAAFPTGAILAGLAAAPAIRWLGSARAATIGTVLTALALLAVSAAPSAPLLALALGLAGACDAITDVAQNAHGLRVQRTYRRSILNSFHAVWSMGAVLGGSMAAAAIALQVPLGLHLMISALLFAVVSLVALRSCLPGADEEARDTSAASPADATDVAPGNPGRTRHAPAVPARTLLVLAALVVLAIGGTLVEDSGNSWAALFLGRDLGASAAVAAYGYIALVGAQFVGRLIGDRMVDRFGQRAVARAGGVLIAVGMGAALAVATVPAVIVGFAAAGLGCATLVPAAMGQADELPGLRHGTGLTVVSWLMRLGFLASPPVVGLVADAASLRVGLLVVPLAGLAVVVSASALHGRRV
ncbi:MFS transporter [Brachybacterium endophyticum]|uniref:MFS transporter n=1 Tax=Brachybacterium endophyticum TaxID=2182385 RepID=A0A2U2RJP1_9MICO|nr:MFS transporter [Brachybacterium endophyticum]PWH06015.1 MFS transporter [Brachybacterium endophyticum]